MAEKVTRKSALSAAIALFPEGDENREVLEKMLEQISKPRKATESKAHKGNVAYAEKLASLVPNGATINSKWVVDNVPEILTTQKAAAILKVATDMGYFEKGEDKKRPVYTRA